MNGAGDAVAGAAKVSAAYSKPYMFDSLRYFASDKRWIIETVKLRI
jgi:hypothetical protein